MAQGPTKIDFLRSCFSVLREKDGLLNRDVFLIFFFPLLGPVNLARDSFWRLRRSNLPHLLENGENGESGSPKTPFTVSLGGEKPHAFLVKKPHAERRPRFKRG